MKNEILVHGVMMYKCEQCGKLEPMYLEKGVEGADKEIPCPFTICCPKCAGWMNHVLWRMDTYFAPRPLEDNESYFAKDIKYGCGKPIFRGI